MARRLSVTRYALLSLALLTLLIPTPANAQDSFNGSCDVSGAFRSNRAHYLPTLTINGHDTVYASIVCSSLEPGYSALVEVGTMAVRGDPRVHDLPRGRRRGAAAP